MTSTEQAAILLVDDEPANLLALEAVLQDLGEPVVLARSGEEAMRALRDGDFAAVLLDVHMPGMDGFETARLIRAQRRSRETPILFITADASDLSAQEGYALGAVDFLPKPLKPEVLKAKLGFFIELHRSRRELLAAERQAVQDRVFLSAVLEAVEDGIVACDAQGRLTLFNRATRDFFGLTFESMHAHEWPPANMLLRPDGRPLAADEMPLARALEGREVQGEELLVAAPGRPRRTMVASGQALRDESGENIGAVVSLHDITAWEELESARAAAAREQIRREEAEAVSRELHESRERLRASEERVRLATDAAGLGVWMWDADTDTVTWENQRMNDVFGVPPGGPPVGSREFLERYVHPDDLARFQSSMDGTLAGGGRLWFVGRILRHADQAVRWIEATGVLQPAPGGGARRILGTVADITERKRAEEEVRASELRYRTLFESIDEGFCIIEMIYDEAGKPVDYRFIETNPAFVKHTGLEDVAGRRMREMVPDHDQHWFELYGRVAAGHAERFEGPATAMGRWFDVYAAPLADTGLPRVAIVFNDITQRRSAAENLRRLASELAESDRRKSEFLATLAHELRNPLAPISNGLHLMRMAPDDAAGAERARQMMQRQLNHLVHLVDDLLDIARISRDKVELRKEPLDLRAVLASAAETSLPLIEGAQHVFGQDIASEPLPVLGDSTRIAQVVSNLLNNAARYTPPGGRIELSARREGTDAVLAITDTGAGIAPDDLPRVFEMFTQVGRDRQNSQGGLGIGLALVKRLVALHGGTVEAHSRGPGRGSTFTVRLPLAAPELHELVASTPGGADAAPASLRVLVVDDNVDAADSLAALLEMQGHTTRVAHEGDSALRMAAEFRPDIVFLDIGMPGKDGYEVARALRASGHMGVLVALTGWGAQDDRTRARDAGFDHHLTKPAGIAAVDALMNDVARSTRAAA